MKVSVVDLPAFRVMCETMYAIAKLRPEECEQAPAMARRAAHDAVSIVQEQRKS